MVPTTKAKASFYRSEHAASHTNPFTQKFYQINQLRKCKAKPSTRLRARIQWQKQLQYGKSIIKVHHASKTALTNFKPSE